MDYIEVSGKNVDEALTNALIKLETTSDKVEYEVIEKGSAGFLGMGRKLAVIKVRKKEDKPVEANVKAKETETQKVADSSVSYEPVKAEPVKSVDNNEIKDDSHEQPKKTSKYTTVMPNEEVERRITTFLGDMFKAMNLEVKIDVKFDDPDCVNVELSGPNMGVLIGKRGQTLDSIQYLTSLVVNKGKDKYVRIKVDTEDYRNRRKETLESLAKNIAYKVKRSRKPVSLEPMNPYERRIIHSALQNDKYVETHSEGEEPYRKVVITLKPGVDTGYERREKYSYGGGRSYNRNGGGYRKKRYGDSSYKKREYNADRNVNESGTGVEDSTTEE